MMKETTKGSISGFRHPPLNQMLNDLSPVLSFQAPHKATLRAPISSFVSTEGGSMLLGVMAMLMDVLGGGLALTTFHPDWAATTYLSVQSAGRALSGNIDARGELKKTERNRVFVRVDIRYTPHERGGFAPVATAILNFTRFSPRRGPQVLRSHLATEARLDASRGNPGLAGPFYDKVGLKILNEAEAIVRVEMSDYVQNSFNVLNGGVAALLADLAGQTAARHITGRPFVTTDLAVHFLRFGEVGPFETKTVVLRKTDETVLSFVKIIDTGAGGRLLSMATNLATLEDRTHGSPHRMECRNDV